jgi:ABC-type glutathione transport system ATPase component
MRHYLSVDDLSTTELPQILELAAELKADPSLHTQALSGRSIALIFEKPSTRTRVSFEVGKGEIVGLVGRSGSGKSTIAKCILGLERPDPGIQILLGKLAPQRFDAALPYSFRHRNAPQSCK